MSDAVPAPAPEDAHRQRAHRVRLDWGPTGAAAIGDDADVAVVVDVLSFSTTVGVAVERGIEVVPARFSGAEAAELAVASGAVVAVGRLEGRARPGVPSLSPAAMQAVEGVRRVVLPSPNGSTTCRVLLLNGGTRVVAGCLRNAGAVAARLAPLVSAGAVVAVVPAGERWPDGSLRPAVEDLWGAGAVLAALLDEQPGAAGLLSPEARVAEQALRAVRDDLVAAVAGCASGLELVARDFAADVAIAAELDSSSVVPVVQAGAFVPWT